jgi:hypothetical protein
MTGQEIKALDSRNEKAETHPNGILVDLSNTLAPFDPNLRTPRGKNAPRINHVTDNGPLNVPKIYRRQVDYEVRKKAGVTKKLSLSVYIKSQKKDKCFITEEFLAHGTKAKVRHISEFMQMEK